MPGSLARGAVSVEGGASTGGCAAWRRCIAAVGAGSQGGGVGVARAGCVRGRRCGRCPCRSRGRSSAL